MSADTKSPLRQLLNLTVLVGALGYFVDIFDLILFPIVRTQSLSDLGVPPDQILPTFVYLFNFQMTGMLIGGVLWGILGDKKGRMSVLFGSITLYSIANIANAFVTTIPAYAAMRFIAGVGLSGELGAAITLVSEVLPKEIRSYGTAVVASVGITGALVADLVGNTM
jgi:MFS family permease